MKITEDYRQLDGLRVMAAMAVVSFHYCPRGGEWLNALISSGPAAVGFFFLLSGFVLTLRHPEVAEWRRFWRARLVRLYPMYLLAFLLFAPIALQKYRYDPKTLAASFVVNVTMLQAWTNLAQSWNGPSWSVSVEAFLYGIFPFLVKRVAKVPNIVFWGLLAVAPAVLTIGFCNQVIPTAFWRTWIENNPLLGVPAFALGIALGFRRLRCASLQRRADLQIAACLLGIVLMALTWPSHYREVFVTGGPIVLFGTLIVLCTYRSPLMQTLLGSPVMVRLGKASYITYIIQSPFWHYFQASANFLYRRPLGEIHDDLPHFLFFTVILLVVSVLLDCYVDAPVRAWLSRRRSHAHAKPVIGSPLKAM